APRRDGAGRPARGRGAVLGDPTGRDHGRPLRPAPPRALMAEVDGTRSLRLAFETEAEPDASGSGRRGLFAAGSHARTVLGGLLSYPEVRYIVPDRISLDVAAGPVLLETIARFLERQRWLVRRVVIE